MKTKTYSNRPSTLWTLLATLPGWLSIATAAPGPCDHFPTDLMPAPTGSFDVAPRLRFGTSPVLFDDLSLRLPSSSISPPAEGSTQTQTCDFTLQCMRSLDNGATFQQVRVPASAILQYTCSSGQCSVEMLSLDSSLPGGVMLRESPTRRSTGQTKRSEAPLGGFRISSFFDIFTELSVDGGQSWTPASSSVRAVQQALAHESPSASSALPPTDSVFTCRTIIRWTSAGSWVVLRNVAIAQPTSPIPPPPPGASAICTTPTTCTGEVSVDGGATFSAFSGPAELTLQITADSSPIASPTRHFVTEVLACACAVSGGTAGGPGFMLRESPTKASLGKTSLRTCPDGRCRSSSFFDIFTELSLDGGQSWTPATDDCATFSTRFNPREYTFSSDLIPFPATSVSDDDCPLSFGQTGVVLWRMRQRPDQMRLPPPSAGQVVRPMGGSADMLVSRDGGATFTRHGGVVTLSECMVSSYQIAGGNDSPIECISFSCTVPGTSPLMIRESPSKASLGRLRESPTIGRHLAGSATSLCLEVSLDGGASWTPADAPLHMSLLPYVEQTGVCKTDFLPPRTGGFEADPPDAGVSYALSSEYLKKKIHRFLITDCSASQAPPPKRGDTVITAFACTVGGEVSSDDGATWVPFQGPGTCTMSVTNPLFQENQTAGENPLYDTEMLALSVSLPGGVMVRESPTKASTGKTSVRFTIKDDRPFAIDSFFDVFTELSVDGGQTWIPGDDSLHLAMHNAPDAAFVRSDWMPYATRISASDGEFSARVSSTQSLRALDLDCDSPDALFSARAPMPAPGSPPVTHQMSAPASFEYSTDGGTTHTAVHATASLTLRCDEFSAASTTSPVSRCRTEVLQCDISGTGLPPGCMLRESPSKASLGKTTCRPAPGGYRVASFFDIFVELSFDGGATWLPACDSLHLATAETSSPVVFPDSMIPPPGVLARHGGALSLRCPIRESPTLATRIGDCTIPPPVGWGSGDIALGASATFSGSCVAELSLSVDDGATFALVRAPLFLRCEMEKVIQDSVQTLYDTEMLQLDCSGGALPTGYMIRESPTKASTGKTSVRSRALGGFSTRSFFDVFLELSIDNGRTWSPFDLPLHLELGDVPVWGADGSTNQWPLLAVHQLPPGDPDFDLLFLDGSHLDAFGMTFDPTNAVALPTPGTSVINSRTCTCPAGLSVSGTVPRRLVVLVGGPSSVKITAGPTSPDGIRSFDTEMLSLDLTLADGIRLRESPSKASLGRLRQSPGSPGAGSSIVSFFDIFFELSTDDGQTWSPADRAVHLDFATPELTVTGPGGVDLADGVSSLDFGTCLVGSPRQLACVLTNHGQAELRVPSLSIDGTNPADFTVSPAPPFTLPPNGGTVAVKVTFASSSAGDKSAALHLACDDPDESPFDLALSARSLVGGADEDGDGVTNGQEVAHADCGFDPFVHSSDLLDLLRGDGFYRSSDMQSLALGNPVLARDAVSGNFHLRLGVLRSPDLNPPWTPMLQLTPTFDPVSGEVDLEFAPPGGSAHFFRVFGEAP